MVQYLKLQKQHLQFPTPCTRLQCRACLDACPVGKKAHAEFFFDVAE